MVDVLITFGLVVFIVLAMIHVVLAGVFFERKVSALIQNRVGANRASVFGIAAMGLINTGLADPIKFLLKEDVRIKGADAFLHTLAPIISVLPAIVSFCVIPFGDVLQVGERTISLQAANLNVGILFILAMASLGVYGVVVAGWASNNRWSLLGGVRGSAQMISYEIPMGLALIGVVMTYNTLDLQEIARQQGTLLWGWLPNWGILYQPIGFIIFFVAGIAESKRVPFDLPESESELVSGYFTEYSGAKHLLFMMADFVEVVIISAMIATLFFGGWQVPYLMRDGFHFPGGASIALPNLVVVVLQVVSLMTKVVFFTWFQVVIRWTVPRFRYDQLMRLGWQGLLPLALLNVVASAFLIIALGKPA